MIPRGPDPSQMELTVRSGAGARFQPCTAFVPAGVTNCSAWTYLVWLKSSVTETPPPPGGGITVADLSAYIPESFISAACARATAEGGPELPPVYDSASDGWAYSEQSQSTWGFETNPIDTSAYAGPAGVFPHGVFCVEVANGSGLTLVIDDNGTDRVARPGETLAYNAEGRDGMFTVFALALDYAGGGEPSGVRVRIAAQPIVQFLSAQAPAYDLDTMMGFTDRDAGDPGVTHSEYVLRVVQARMLDRSRVEHCIWGAAHDIMYLAAATVTNSLDTPNAAPFFAPGARVGINLHNPLNGVTPQTPRTNDAVYVYGPKLFLSWLSTDDVRAIRDQDAAVMRRRGIEFPDRTDYWRLTWERKTRTISTDGPDLSGEADHSATGGERCVFGYHVSGGTVSNLYEFTATVHNGDYNRREISMSDIRLTAPGAAGVDGNVVTYPQPAAGTVSETHTIYAEDTATGTVKTNDVHIYVGATNSYTTTVTSRGEAGASAAAKAASHSLSNALANMTWDDGSMKTATWHNASHPYRDWKVKRIPCLPVSSTSGPQGNRGMCALSPHTYFTAWHWQGWVRGTQRYVTPDGTTTAAVTTASGAVNLASWAKSHGFDAAWVDGLGIGDIAVNRYSAGEVPAECCPVLLSSGDMLRLYGTNSTSAPCAGTPLVHGWCGTQTRAGHALPVAIYPDLGDGAGRWYHRWRTPREIMAWTDTATSQIGYPGFDGLIATEERNWITNAAVSAARGEDPLFPPIYGGDSGLGIYIDTGGGGYALVSHFHSVGSGPSYVAAFPLLKAWIESNGDAVRTYDPPER